MRAQVLKVCYIIMKMTLAEYNWKYVIITISDFYTMEL